MAKRYYWLKIQKDFAKDKRVKKLKNIPGGLNFAFIYLEILLSTIEMEGIFMYEGIEDTVAKEIALEIDEDPDNVQITISYLMSVGLMEDLGDGRFLFPYVSENLGSEGASAKRVRDFRDRQKALQCNTDVTEEKREALHCNTDVTEKKRFCNVETDIEKETEKDIDKTDRLEINGCLSDRTKYIPTLEEVVKYVEDNHLPIDPKKFYEKNLDRGWTTKNGQPIKRWKSVLWYWAQNEKQPEADKNSFQQNTYDFEALEKEFMRN